MSGTCVTCAKHDTCFCSDKNVINCVYHKPKLDDAERTTELLPCPFCGGSNLDLTYKDTWHDDFRRGVYCADCGAGIYPYETSKDEAVAKWNTRVADKSETYHDDFYDCDSKFGVTAKQMADACADFNSKLPSASEWERTEKDASEQDSREKLEEELFHIVRNILNDGALREADPTGNYTRKPKWEPEESIVNAWVEVLIPRLDRQSAITEREVHKGMV